MHLRIYQKCPKSLILSVITDMCAFTHEQPRTQRCTIHPCTLTTTLTQNATHHVNSVTTCMKGTDEKPPRCPAMSHRRSPIVFDMCLTFHESTCPSLRSTCTHPTECSTGVSGSQSCSQGRARLKRTRSQRSQKLALLMYATCAPEAYEALHMRSIHSLL